MILSAYKPTYDAWSEMLNAKTDIPKYERLSDYCFDESAIENHKGCEIMCPHLIYTNTITIASYITVCLMNSDITTLCHPEIE